MANEKIAVRKPISVYAVSVGRLDTWPGACGKAHDTTALTKWMLDLVSKADFHYDHVPCLVLPVSFDVLVEFMHPKPLACWIRWLLLMSWAFSSTLSRTSTFISPVLGRRCGWNGQRQSLA